MGNPAGILIYMPGGEERDQKVDSRSELSSLLAMLPLSEPTAEENVSCQQYGIGAKTNK